MCCLFWYFLACYWIWFIPLTPKMITWLLKTSDKWIGRQWTCLLPRTVLRTLLVRCQSEATHPVQAPLVWLYIGHESMRPRAAALVAIPRGLLCSYPFLLHGSFLQNRKSRTLVLHFQFCLAGSLTSASWADHFVLFLNVVNVFHEEYVGLFFKNVLSAYFHGDCH